MKRFGGFLVIVFLLVSCGREDQSTGFTEEKIWIDGKEQIIRSTVPKRELGPKLKIKIQKSTYEYGYLKVIGVIENIGDRPAFSPTIKLRVYDSSSRTLLAEDTAWPAGHYGKNMDPGISAAFQCMNSIPGEPGHIKYQIMIEKYDFDVDYH